MFFYFKKIESKICPPKVAKLLRLVPSKHVNSKKSPLLNDHLKNSENLYLFGVIQHLRGDNFAIFDPPPRPPCGQFLYSYMDKNRQFK